VTGGWRKLHDKELRDLYSASIIRMIKSKRMSCAGHERGGKRNACRLLVRNPDGRRPLGRPRCRWLDNSKMYLLEIGCGDVD
jgi:hypothetical protein